MENQNQSEYELSPAWSKAKGFKKPFDHVCSETGQKVRIRRLDMGDLLKLDIAEEMDFMSKAVMSTETPAQEKPEAQTSQEAVANAIKNSKNFSKMEKMINLVVAAGVIKPQLYAAPEHENARQAGLNYVDEVPWNDRMELFSVIFEMDGIATFREEEEPGVGDVADVPSVPLPAERPVDVRPSDTEGVLLQ